MLLLAAIDQSSSAFRTGRICAIVVLGVLVLVLGLRALDSSRTRDSAARRNNAIGALVCAALLAVAALHAGAGQKAGGGGVWDTQQGREMRAGFVAGCQRSAGDIVDCDCVFQRLTSAPPYDTPTGFISLAQVGNVVMQAGSGSLPPQIVNAVVSCRSASSY